MARKTAVADPVSPDQVAALENALLEAVRNPRHRRPGPKCAVSKVMSQLPASTATKVTAAIDDENNTAAEIADILINAGFDISAFSVARHRRRGQSNGCRCSND